MAHGNTGPFENLTVRADIITHTEDCIVIHTQRIVSLSDPNSRILPSNPQQCCPGSQSNGEILWTVPQHDVTSRLYYLPLVQELQLIGIACFRNREFFCYFTINNKPTILSRARYGFIDELSE